MVNKGLSLDYIVLMISMLFEGSSTIKYIKKKVHWLTYYKCSWRLCRNISNLMVHFSWDKVTKQ